MKSPVRRAFVLLARRDWNSTLWLVMTFLGLSFFLAFFPVLTGSQTAGKAFFALPRLAAMTTLFCLIQQVQATVLAEKLRGTFSFLRTLPVGDSVIIGAKSAVSCLSATVTYAIPTAVGLVGMSYCGMPVSGFQVWSAVWIWAYLMTNGLALVGSAILFRSRVFFPLPLLVLLVPFLLLWYVNVKLPSAWNRMLELELYAWLIPLAALLPLGGWRWARWCFVGRDIRVLVD